MIERNSTSSRSAEGIKDVFKRYDISPPSLTAKIVVERKGGEKKEIVLGEVLRFNQEGIVKNYLEESLVL